MNGFIQIYGMITMARFMKIDIQIAVEMLDAIAEDHNQNSVLHHALKDGIPEPR